MRKMKGIRTSGPALGGKASKAHVCNGNVCVIRPNIYIYMERDRERERERDKAPRRVMIHRICMDHEQGMTTLLGTNGSFYSERCSQCSCSDVWHGDGYLDSSGDVIMRSWSLDLKTT